MAKKGELFFLIKSLSKAEKRYFRLFAQMNKSGANYLRLFDAIDQQERYDELAIKEMFQGETFVKQLHVTKNYLSKLILKCLRNYYQGHSKSAGILDLLRDIEILFHKELYDQAWYSIEKACQVALEYEKYPLLLEAYGWKRKWLLNRHGPVKAKEALVEIIQAENEALQKWQRYNKYWELVANLFTWVNEEDERGKYENKLAAQPLFQEVDPTDTLRSRVLYYHLQYGYAFMKYNDVVGADHYIDELIALLESHPLRIQDDPSAYITALTNKIGSLLSQQKRNEIPPLLQKIRTVPQKYKLKQHSRLALRLLLQTYNVELELYRDTGEIEKGLKVIKEAEHFLLENDALPANYDLLLAYQFAYLYFLSKDYRKALFWLNHIFQLKSETTREDILSFARLLNLIIQFELKNIMVLKYAIDSTRRFLKKKRNLHDFERVLLQFFSKICNQPSKAYRASFIQLKEDLFANTPSKDVAQTLDYLDFMRWIGENC